MAHRALRLYGPRRILSDQAPDEVLRSDEH